MAIQLYSDMTTGLLKRFSAIKDPRQAGLVLDKNPWNTPLCWQDLCYPDLCHPVGYEVFSVGGVGIPVDALKRKPPEKQVSEKGRWKKKEFTQRIRGQRVEVDARWEGWLNHLCSCKPLKGLFNVHQPHFKAKSHIFDINEVWWRLVRRGFVEALES